MITSNCDFSSFSISSSGNRYLSLNVMEELHKYLNSLTLKRISILSII